MNIFIQKLILLKNCFINKIKNIKRYLCLNWKKLLFFILWDLSGIRFIYEKVHPQQNSNEKPASTLFIWLIGINMACWGLAMTKYEFKNNVTENRMANIIPVAIANPEKYNDYQMLIDYQYKKMPLEPSIFNPVKTLVSLFEIKNVIPKSNIESIKECIVANRESLSNENLAYANLQNADLRNGNFISSNLSNVDLTDAFLKNANFYNADLSNVKGLTIEQLKEVQSIAEATISPKLLEQIKMYCPDILEKRLINKDLTDINFYSNKIDNDFSLNIDTNEYKLDLSNTDFSKSDLSNVDLSKHNLSGANFYSANLSGANLSKANLSNATLIEANLSNVNLFGTNLSNAKLFKATLNDADLTNANLTSAYLCRAKLTRTYWAQSILINADLSFSNLTTACFYNANLSGANLDNAIVNDARFPLTDLSNAKNVGALIDSQDKK